MSNIVGNMADAIYQQRTRLQLSQGELAERAGVSRHTVVNIEGGRTAGIRMETIGKVLDALGLQIGIYPAHRVSANETLDAKEERGRFRRRFVRGEGDAHVLLTARK